MISFVVPAFNEERLLGQTIQAIRDAAHALGEPFEVVVADDASTDRTAEIAESQGARVVLVRNRQIAATRNAGARAAVGEILIFVDADTLVTKAAVAAAVATIGSGAVGGGCIPRFDGRIPFSMRLFLAAAVPLYRLAGLAPGCFLFCTRKAFDAAGGFDETMFGAEEIVLSRSLGRQGRFVILREFVMTSGRKLRSYSAVEIFGLLLRLAIKGPRSLRRREGLDIWYGDRRSDPEQRTQPPLRKSVEQSVHS